LFGQVDDEGVDERVLVRKVLVQAADADPCFTGHAVGAETVPSVAEQNASSRTKKRLDEGLAPLLLGSLTKGLRP
jgi:hypothetical protein